MSLLAGSIIAVWVVSIPVANLHSRPEAGADVVSQAIHGVTLGPADEAPGASPAPAGWARVQTPDGYEGWVARADFLESPTAYPAGGRGVRVGSLFANVYAGPDVTKQAPLVTLPFEALLEVVAEPPDQDRRWVQVRLPDRRLAWVQRGDLLFDPAAADAGRLIELARRFEGLPYLWGGTSTFGFDCSGFTQMLYRQLGIPIPRDSGPQARWEGMSPVAREELEAGDLLFFGASPEEVNHTGMYIGGGEFIHATTHLRPVVQVSRLDDPHWSALLVGCRRPGKASQ